MIETHNTTDVYTIAENESIRIITNDHVELAGHIAWVIKAYGRKTLIVTGKINEMQKQSVVARAIGCFDIFLYDEDDTLMGLHENPSTFEQQATLNYASIFLSKSAVPAFA